MTTVVVLGLVLSSLLVKADDHVTLVWSDEFDYTEQPNPSLWRLRRR